MTAVPIFSYANGKAGEVLAYALPTPYMADDPRISIDTVDIPLLYNPTAEKAGDIAAGVVIGTSKFVWNSTPIASISRDFENAADYYNDPDAAAARSKAQGDALINFGKELTTPEGRSTLVGQVEATWNGMSLTNKASVSTQVGLSLGMLFVSPSSGAAGTETASTVGTEITGEVIPSTVVRVIPASIDAATLGPLRAPDVFVTSGGVLDGMTSSGISNGLTIPQSPSGFNLYEFPTPGGIASPINRMDPGFIGGGKTAGGLPEYVIPNGPIPTNATKTFVPPGQ